jgi:predicted nucleic acid-binding protein
MTHNLKSATYKIVQLLFKGEITLLYNNEIIAEYVDVLSRPYLKISTNERDALLAFIREHGIATNRITYDELLIDEDDRVFYEITLSKEDSFLVTGNLKHFPIDPRVVTPAQMLQILGD